MEKLIQRWKGVLQKSWIAHSARTRGRGCQIAHLRDYKGDFQGYRTH